MKPALLSAIFGFFLCACHVPTSTDASFTPFLDEDPYGPGPSVPYPKRDLADPAPPGSVRTIDEPWRTIEGAPSGRIRMLEMYQAAVSQRDRSSQRAADLERELEAVLARTTAAEQANAELEARNAGLSAELGEIRSKALELARRLAHAELSLLQSEKAELEIRATPAAKRRTP